MVSLYAIFDQNTDSLVNFLLHFDTPFIFIYMQKQKNFSGFWVFGVLGFFVDFFWPILILAQFVITPYSNIF